MRNIILEKSKNEKLIIGIRIYGDEDKIWLGYIEDYNEKIIQLRYFDQFGFEDGLVVESQDNIESIDFESNYEKTYQHLINKRQDISKIDKIIDFKDTEDWRAEYLHDYVMRNEILSLGFNAGTILYGFVCEVAENEFVFNTIGNIGEDEGKTVYKIEDISSFRFADKKSKLLQELYIWRKTNKTCG